MIKRFLFFSSFVALFFVFSCQKEESSFDEGQIETEFSEETSIANMLYAKIYQISRNEVQYIESIEEIELEDAEEINKHDSCAIISYYFDSNNVFVSYVEIIFNDTSCISRGRKKFGKLKVYLTGNLNEVGTRMTIIPKGFFLNGKKVEGTIVVNNMGFNEDYRYEYSKKVIDGKICLNANKYFTWNSNTLIILDFFHREMIYETQVDAVNRNGRAYKVETIDPLISEFDCRYFQSGELELKSDWGLRQILNFGDGDCDNKAEIWTQMRAVELDLN